MNKLAIAITLALVSGCGANAVLDETAGPATGKQTFNDFLTTNSSKIPADVMAQLQQLAGSDASLASAPVGADADAPALPPEEELTDICLSELAASSESSSVMLTSSAEEQCGTLVDPLIDPYVPPAGGSSSSCSSSAVSAPVSSAMLVSGDCSSNSGSSGIVVNAEFVSGLFVHMRTGNNGYSVDQLRSVNLIPGTFLDVKDYAAIRFQIEKKYGNLRLFYAAYFRGENPTVTLHRLASDFGKFGDVDQDNDVDWNDVTAIISYMFPNGSSLTEAGINAGNVAWTYLEGGIVDLSDLTLLVQYNIYQDELKAGSSESAAVSLASKAGSVDVAKDEVGSSTPSSPAMSLPAGQGAKSILSLDLNSPAPQPTPTPTATPAPSGNTQCPVDQVSANMLTSGGC